MIYVEKSAENLPLTNLIAKEHNIGSGFNDWHYKGLNRAIEIVKQGGRDEE